MDTLDDLLQHSRPLLDQVKDETAGLALENVLNERFGPGSSIYDDLAAIIKRGVADGWAANVEVDGRRYRRSKLSEPSAATFYFSVTAVYMESDAPYRGQYHTHPYGEINMLVPLSPDAQMVGPKGWYGAGWTSPAPGSHHYPEVRGGKMIALFFLPAGRISYARTGP